MVMFLANNSTIKKRMLMMRKKHSTFLRRTCIYAVLLCICLCGCISEKTDLTNPYRFPHLADEQEVTGSGSLITEKYKGKVMYYCEQLYSEDKSILVSTMYCGYGTERPMVKVRIYAEHKNVEHKEWGYSYFQEEYVSFRQECITFNSPMILMLETIGKNGELARSGYISQWESAEFYEKFTAEHNIIHRSIPEETIIKQVLPRNVLPDE